MITAKCRQCGVATTMEHTDDWYIQETSLREDRVWGTCPDCLEVQCDAEEKDRLSWGVE